MESQLCTWLLLLLAITANFWAGQALPPWVGAKHLNKGLKRRAGLSKGGCSTEAPQHQRGRFPLPGLQEGAGQPRRVRPLTTVGHVGAEVVVDTGETREPIALSVPNHGAIGWQRPGGSLAVRGHQLGHHRAPIYLWPTDTNHWSSTTLHGKGKEKAGGWGNSPTRARGMQQAEGKEARAIGPELQQWRSRTSRWRMEHHLQQVTWIWRPVWIWQSSGWPIQLWWQPLELRQRWQETFGSDSRGGGQEKCKSFATCAAAKNPEEAGAAHLEGRPGPQGAQ